VILPSLSDPSVSGANETALPLTPDKTGSGKETMKN